MRGGQRLPVKPHKHAGAARVFAPDEHRGGFMCSDMQKQYELRKDSSALWARRPAVLQNVANGFFLDIGRSKLGL
jgi:hypothetical protein